MNRREMRMRWEQHLVDWLPEERWNTQECHHLKTAQAQLPVGTTGPKVHRRTGHVLWRVYVGLIYNQILLMLVFKYRNDPLWTGESIDFMLGFIEYEILYLFSPERDRAE